MFDFGQKASRDCRALKNKHKYIRYINISYGFTPTPHSISSYVPSQLHY